MTPPRPSSQPGETPSSRSLGLMILAWLFVGIPLAWGVMQTLSKALVLFR